MIINDAGLNIVKEYEKCRLEAFLPTPNDVPTLGWGHTQGVKLGDSCTQEKADDWLRSDIHRAETCVEQSVLVPLTENEFSALVSLVYNIGVGAFRDSTLLRRLNDERMDDAAEQFLVWNKQKGRVLNGLVRRRQEEKDLFERSA